MPTPKRRVDVVAAELPTPDAEPNGSMIGPLICVGLPILALILYGVFF